MSSLNYESYIAVATTLSISWGCLRIIRISVGRRC